MNLVPQQALLPGSNAPIGTRDVASVPTTKIAPTIVVGGVVLGWDGSKYVVADRATRRRASLAASRLIGSTGTTLSGQQSMIQQIPAQGPFTGVIPFWVNLDTAATRAFALSYIAACPTDANDGTLLTWKAANVNGAQGGTIPQATGSGADRSPGILVGDHIPLKSVARTDFPAKPPLIMARTLFPSGHVPMALGTGKLLAMCDSSGLEYKSRASATDYVTVPTTFWQPIATAGAGNQLHMGLKICYTGKSISVAVPGDSTRSGTGSTADFFSGIDVAAKLARADGKMIIESAKWAIPSQTSAGMVRNARAIIASGLKPDVMLIPTWSTNDGVTAEAFALGMTVALMLARECEVAGIAPVLLSPPPSVAVTSGAVEALWTSHRNAVLALGGDYIVCDCYAPLLDPAAPGRFLGSYSADGYHPNDAGYALEGAVTYDTLMRWF